MGWSGEVRFDKFRFKQILKDMKEIVTDNYWWSTVLVKGNAKTTKAETS